MTNLLLRLFTDSAAPEDRYRMQVGKLSGIVGILCNAILCGLKLLVGTLSGSVSITADAMNNLSDATSSVVTLVGFRLSEIPPDKNHPYGHARFEYLSGLAVAAMILIIGVQLLETSVGKIFHPEAVEFSLPVALVLIGSILVKLWLSLFNGRLGKAIHSPALMASAADSRNDTFSTGAVLAAAGIEAISGWRIDGWVGLAVALFILWSGVSMGMETISPLLGEATNPEVRDAIVKTLSACPEVLGYHDLLVHDYGPGKCFASIHVEMDRNRDVMESHEIIDNLEKTVWETYHVQLVIHFDPIVVGDPKIDETRARVTDYLWQMDPRLNMHDFRMVPGKGHTNLIFDVVLPLDMQGREDEVVDMVEHRMSGPEYGRVYAIVNFDSEVFNSL